LSGVLEVVPDHVRDFVVYCDNVRTEFSFAIVFAVFGEFSWRGDLVLVFGASGVPSTVSRVEVV
jgi:hypothetical protein